MLGWIGKGSEGPQGSLSLSGQKPRLRLELECTVVYVGGDPRKHWRSRVGREGRRPAEFITVDSQGSI